MTLSDRACFGGRLRSYLAGWRGWWRIGDRPGAGFSMDDRSPVVLTSRRRPDARLGATNERDKGNRTAERSGQIGLTTMWFIAATGRCEGWLILYPLFEPGSQYVRWLKRLMGYAAREWGRGASSILREICRKECTVARESILYTYLENSDFHWCKMLRTRQISLLAAIVSLM